VTWAQTAVIAAVLAALSVTPANEHYATARRRAAWTILAGKMDRPEQAVRFANPT
jgi:hypothetical protein